MVAARKAAAFYAAHKQVTYHTHGPRVAGHALGGLDRGASHLGQKCVITGVQEYTELGHGRWCRQRVPII